MYHPNHTGTYQTSSVPSVHLVPDLRLALAILYSLPQPHHHPQQTASTRPTPAQAHDYLLQFQSKNVRRKLQSQAKSQQSKLQVHHQNQYNQHNLQLQQQQQQQQQQVEQEDHDDSSSSGMNTLDVGSSWLACLSLLFSLIIHQDYPNQQQQQQERPDNRHQYQVHYPEALFAAQTLVHRVRRVRLAEAIDVEFEPATRRATNGSNPIDMMVLPAMSSSFPPHPQDILNVYRQWIFSFATTDSPTVGTLACAIGRYHPLLVEGQNQSDLEERIKGELSLLVLACIVDRLTRIQYRHHHPDGTATTTTTTPATMLPSQIRPLLSTLASAMAVIAARIRYVPATLPEPAPHTQPIVTMILGSLRLMQTQPTKEQQMMTPSSQYDTPPHEEAVACLYCTSLKALPEAILASAGGGGGGDGGGGAHGKFSLEPRCFMGVATELKTQSIVQVWQSLQELTSRGSSTMLSLSTIVLLLQLCESWAKCVPLPIEFVQQTIPLVLQTWTDSLSSSKSDHVAPLSSQQHHAAKAAMGYWIAIMEGGSWTVDQVLASSLFQNKEASQQPNKKRQSSRSKRREQQVLEERTTDDQLLLAQDEVRRRGEVACEMARATWNPQFHALLEQELGRIAAVCRAQQGIAHPSDYDDEEDVRGDGPVGGIAACSNACLPHLLRTASSGEHDSNSMELFTSISRALQQVCTSPSRMVRSFAAESLTSLHEVFVQILAKDPSLLTGELLNVVVECFFQSSMGLASQCGYPTGYFNDLGRNNDDDLEAERNDVRDLLRMVAGISPSLSEKPASLAVTSTILLRLVQACGHSILDAVASNVLFPESALHAFSALAKPINTVASLYVNSPEDAYSNNPGGDSINAILSLAFQIMTSAGTCVVQAFPVVSRNEILPLSRLYNLAVASLSPMLSTLASVASMESTVRALVQIGIEAATRSLLSLPELPGPSSLRSTRFDIRGAMRSPGGEDHVGVLALMRLSSESNILTQVFVSASESVVHDLCSLYQELKKLEDQRGPGIFYGIGVLPKSRRILLGIICRLELTSNSSSGVSRELSALLDSSVDTIVNVGSHQAQFSAESLFRVSENAFDIAAFSPTTVNSLFALSDANSQQARCLQVLHNVGNVGYVFYRDPMVPDENIIQWNRARAALFALFRASGNPDLPPIATDMIISLIKVECEAILAQCSDGPTSTSRIFCEGIVSEEVVPAGLFVQVLVEILEKALGFRTPLPLLKNALRALHESCVSVIHVIASPCPSPTQKGAFEDPRPTVAETWFSSMKQLAVLIARQGGLETSTALDAELVSVLKTLLVETCVVAIRLLLFSSLGKTQDDRKEDPGLNLDGPQGLALMDFFEVFFDLGPGMLKAAAVELASAIPVDSSGDNSAAGMAIIGAALFRAAQGGLPPWAVERIPSVYSSLFKALGNSVETFVNVLDWSMHIRLRQDHRCGSVNGGNLLSGKFFDRMGEKSKTSFLEQAQENVIVNSAASWKRLKGLIKQACGGKKKDTDFNQRPSFTRWDTLDRL